MGDSDIRVRRSYEEPAPGDGARVLVDRVWPVTLLTATREVEISQATVLARLLRETNA